MSKNNYIKEFIRIKDNFETTEFISNKYLELIDEYHKLKYDDDVDDTESRHLEYELKHYGKLLLSCIYNDWEVLKKFSDGEVHLYREKSKLSNLYKTMERLMQKDIFFEDGKIKVEDLIYRNRIKINHADNKRDEMSYIDYYNSMISSDLYDKYMFDIVITEEKIIDAIETEIGSEKINLVKSNHKSKETINANYFKIYNKLINEILQSLKQSEIDINDYNKIEQNVKKIIKNDNENKLIDKDIEAINEIKSTISDIKSMINKYSLMAKIDNNKMSNEDYLVNTIFYNNKHVVENLLTELIEILLRIIKDVSNGNEKMLNNLYSKKREISDTTISIN